MGVCRHGQEGALAPPPSGSVVKCFCALVVTTKRSVDELFLHYFHNLSSASGSLTPTVNQSMVPLGDFRPQTPNLPITPGKTSACTHAVTDLMNFAFSVKFSPLEF